MKKETQMHAVLLHGMGRTPLAMSLLAARLRANNIHPHLFGYLVTFEQWDNCMQRLEKFIESRVQENEYILIGHSLGAVMVRAVLPRLSHRPSACFLLASPARVCKAARTFMPRRFARLLGGEIGQLLVNEQFMNSLHLNGVPAKIYAGSGGPRGRYSPFGKEPNDGVLTVQETSLPGVPVQTVPTVHTFIMNSRIVSQDIIKITRTCSSVNVRL